MQEDVVAQKRKTLDELRAAQKRIAEELRRVAGIVDIIKEAINNYNPVTLLLRNWLGDMRVASEEYIKTSHRAGLLLLNTSGSPVSQYKTWLSCYANVFLGVPRQIGQAGCFGKDSLERLKAEYDKAIDGLPEILRWIIAPTREIEKKVTAQLRPEIDKAERDILVFLTDDENTVDFLLLVADPNNASREKMIEAFQADGTNKRLLVFANVADLVDRDIGRSGGELDPGRFAALSHAITMVKLALLDPQALNALVSELAPNYVSPRYGAPLYPARPGNFTLLFDVLRSIDGNHQWQAYGLPYPRSRGGELKKPGDLPFGHDHFAIRSRGLQFWVDPYLRERMFLAMFPTAVLGTLGERPELQWKTYPFPACPQNPFPATQDINGKIPGQG